MPCKAKRGINGGNDRTRKAVNLSNLDTFQSSPAEQCFSFSVPNYSLFGMKLQFVREKTFRNTAHCAINLGSKQKNTPHPGKITSKRKRKRYLSR